MTSYYESMPAVRYSTGFSPEEAEGFLAQFGIKPNTESPYFILQHLGAWITAKWFDYLKKPYFKISTAFASKLVNLKTEMPSRMIAIPMPAFSIRLEKNHGIAPLRYLHPRGTDHEVESILVSCFPATINMPELQREPFSIDAQNDRSLLTVIRFSGNGIAAHRTELLAEKFPNMGTGRSDNKSLLKCCESVSRLAIGVCCLATSNREWLTPDVLNRDVEKYSNCRSDEEKKRIEHRAVSNGKRGWIINPEILLPRETQDSSRNELPTGKHLKFRHHRSSHVAMIRCGKNRQASKLVIRKWCIVRPDLPDNPNHQKKYRTM